MDLFKIFKENFSLENIKGQVTAARNTAQVIESLLSLMQDNKISNSVKEMLGNLKVLVKDQPNIVSINHFINHFLLKLNPENQPIVLKELLEVFHERWKHVDRKTASVAFNLHDLKGKTIAFYGNDSSMTALVDICVVHQSNTSVVQILAKNDKEAKEQAVNILQQHVSVTAVDLYNIGRLHDKIDYLYLSADVIMHETFITKSGGHLLATWARRHQIPVMILSDSRKILNKKILPASVLGTFINESKKSPNDIWKGAPEGIEVINYHLEEVSSSLVDFFVLEQQAYTPLELSHEVDKILVSKFI